MYTSLISADELARQLSDPALVLVDCRHNLSDVDAGQRAYGASHLPGARFMHMDRDLSGERTGSNGRHPLPDVAALSGSLSRAGIDASKQVVAYDQNNGMWASRLWWLLRWLGHDAAAVLDGGIDKWIAEGRPTTADPPSVRAARFVAARQFAKDKGRGSREDATQIQLRQHAIQTIRTLGHFVEKQDAPCRRVERVRRAERRAQLCQRTADQEAGGFAGVQNFNLWMRDFVSRFRPAQAADKRCAIVSALATGKTPFEHRPVKRDDAADQREPRQ